MRLSSAHKALIKRAAAIRGQPVSAFAVSALLERAEEVVARHDTTTLSSSDFARFLSILDDDRPNARLRAAVRRQRSRRG